MKRGKREGRKERGRERERKGRCSQLRKSSRDTPKKERGDPEYCIQESPRKQRKKGGGKGEEGLSARQVPTNLKSTSVALTTLRH